MFPVVPSNRAQPQPQPRIQAQTQAPAEEEAEADEDEEPPAPQRREGTRKTKEIQESACELSSIKDLRKRIIVKEHQGMPPKLFSRPCYYPDAFTQGLHEVLEGHVFVGIVDLDRCLSLVQHSTQLYLLNHGSLA